mmetsp:Transcript_23505/g.36242  ORF Transcript_23505/g.36242 Transcript_23505/m.36242 type:complete len:522 (-) Transcript_23505:221-1786(-)|eukprot:CAMPEP_0196813854 /NCGR_PEP_ID=MMETSP1362-20130617/39707_1 /TAXON_ID=163516 /ORGANISM="Leptocylindrus danicus, Strain CCMP1856" /LENGTH=521 /DNA_ID=CAMNT_0042190261 /DNA_START=252 /DNA_END=1817 /DNA_ORIENTATION=+
MLLRLSLLILLTAPTTISALSISTGTANNKTTYDLIVIGGGSAGLTAAKFAATFQKSVVIVDAAGRLGGDCTWTGCVPSKTLLSCAKAAFMVKNAKKYGVVTSSDDVRVDWEAIKQRIRATQEHIYEEDDSPEVMKSLGIDTILGKAEFQSSNSIQVALTTLTDDDDPNENKIVQVHAKDGIVIATGASPKEPVPGGPSSSLEGIHYVTYEDVFELDKLPKTMTVVGGGPIGCELAQAFSRFGIDVTIIAEQLLPRNEPEVSSTLEEVFTKEGIRIVKGRVENIAPGKVDGHHVVNNNIEGELLLLAVGRKPVVHGMNLEQIGVELNSQTGGIAVDDQLRSSVKGVYAAGDCTGDRQFTHYAGYQGAVAARNALLPFTDPGVLTSDVPGTTFTSPEVASVGLTEAEAREKLGSDKVSIGFQKVADVDRAVCEGTTDGFIKIVYKTKNYEILGATIVSPRAGELISEIGVAMKAGMKFDTLATVMHSYPSFSFALQVMAAEVYYAKLGKLKGVLNILKKIGL